MDPCHSKNGCRTRSFLGSEAFKEGLKIPGILAFKERLQNPRRPGIHAMQRRDAEHEASWDPCHSKKGCRTRDVLGSMPFKERLQNLRPPGIHAVQRRKAAAAKHPGILSFKEKLHSLPGIHGTQRKAAELGASWDPCHSKNLNGVSRHVYTCAPSAASLASLRSNGARTKSLF